MNKKLPIYILIIYFIFVMVILVLQLAGREKSGYVAVGFNDRLDSAVVVYEKSPIMLKKQKQTFINEDNTSQTPIMIEGVNYLPLCFYKNGFDAVVSYNQDKGQLTIKYDNKALVAETNSTEAKLSTAERDKKTQLSYAPVVINGECLLAVRDFADVFGLELFYDDGLIILSSMKDIFDKETEGELIENIKDLVYNLPLASYEIVKELYSPEDEEEEAEKLLKTEDDSELYIFCRDDYVYFYDGERVVKATDMPYGSYDKLCYIILPTGFDLERLSVLGDYVCAEGSKNGLAAFCLLDMTGDYGIMRKYVCMDGECGGAVISDGYVYFASLCDPVAANEQSFEGVNGYVPISYDNVRYFSEHNGDKLLSVMGFDLENLSEEGVYSGFFGVDSQICFCGSGVYVGQEDKNNVYGDDEGSYSNYYKLAYEEGTVSFENIVRLEGDFKLVSQKQPLFTAENDKESVNIYVLDSLLNISASSLDVEAPCRALSEGDERIFLTGEQGEDIAVFSSADGEYLGSFKTEDEKLYLYNDERVIGFSEFMPEAEEAPEEEESAQSEEAAEDDEIEEVIYPSVKMTMYDISKPDEAEVVSTEIIENCDPSMFEELEPELGDGVVIIPVKVYEEDGTLFEGKYGYIESSFYGLKFQDRR
ncbi:MAG: hypothetical protein LIO87_01555 [Eubacterium sp.]|nr:hypothetical protein [Eubacterium sp.]